jgi:hypothetical protein
MTRREGALGVPLISVKYTLYFRLCQEPAYAFGFGDIYGSGTDEHCNQVGPSVARGRFQHPADGAEAHTEQWAGPQMIDAACQRLADDRCREVGRAGAAKLLDDLGIALQCARKAEMVFIALDNMVVVWYTQYRL